MRITLPLLLSSALVAVPVAAFTTTFSISDHASPKFPSVAHNVRSTTASRSATGLSASYSNLLSEDAYNTIDQGGIAVVNNFVSSSQVSRLRRDAQSLYNNNHFITDALAGYGKKAAQRDKDQFDPSKDRSVLPAYIPSRQKNGPFVDASLGDAQARKDFTQLIATLRSDLANRLDRPGMDTPDGPNNHEISYTRFGAGAYLKRHQDEHHEELKGVKGWSNPTRRSLSWLVYLNEDDWDADLDRGYLRTYPRIHTPSNKVGSRQGDLQLGWLTPTLRDPYERPVFLDGQRHDTSGNCALYVDHPDRSGERLYLTRNFKADPYLFLATDFVVQHILIANREYGNRFRYLEPPKSLVTDYWDRVQKQKGIYTNNKGEYINDVSPLGGTLVVFDSITLPHEVMATVGRDRWAASGWFHEAQQEIPPREQWDNRIM